MGIPSYFNFILKNHRTIVKEKRFIRCDYLFVDANSLIYDCIHELNHVDDYEQVYAMIHEKMMNLIQTLHPTTKTYFCFDGVPPYAKMVQQRQRRFKSILTKQILKQENTSWNTNHITPGTDFMNRLDAYLIERFKGHRNIVFSGSQEPMEGEHKICHILRSQKQLFLEKNVMIYGLDADLIMLGLLLQIEPLSIYLYKETKHFQYISQVDETKDYYFQMSVLVKEVCLLLQQEDPKQGVYDYIFMCFLCGNDFLPHIPSIQLRNDGIHELISQYKQTNKTLIDTHTMRIQWKHLSLLFHALGEKEDDLILQNLEWKLQLKRQIHTKTQEDRLQFLPCLDVEKETYLKSHLQDYNSYILEVHCAKQHCLDYLRILEWTWYYYNGENLNDRTSYEHHYGPRIKDLLLYMPLFNGDRIIEEKKQDTIDVFTQLFFVLPYTNHAEIIPKDVYEKCSSILYTYIPTLKEMNYPFSYFLCKFFWESHLQMTPIHIDSLNTYVKRLNNNL
tara:strand:+ start:189 stop:1700 length:1512 start_codon:yes stop_codon:yes gene_type:complete